MGPSSGHGPRYSVPPVPPLGGPDRGDRLASRRHVTITTKSETTCFVWIYLDTQDMWLYIVTSQKTQDTLLMSITSRNIDGYSKFYIANLNKKLATNDHYISQLKM